MAGAVCLDRPGISEEFWPAWLNLYVHPQAGKAGLLVGAQSMPMEMPGSGSSEAERDEVTTLVGKVPDQTAPVLRALTGPLPDPGSCSTVCWQALLPTVPGSSSPRRPLGLVAAPSG